MASITQNLNTLWLQRLLFQILVRLNGEDYRISRYPRRSNICFLWRACQDCIPTQFRLLQRGIEINDVCVFCASAGKTREHVLVTCPYACDLMSMFLLAVAGSGF
ncbi:hypothetical protein NC651_018426 [Populus alba x Populus x berolinensis]|nr:hypothetical protein NC651_018426 [Populus alba x Populus x berolinensis]